jgi:hypothetical protein
MRTIGSRLGLQDSGRPKTRIVMSLGLPRRGFHRRLRHRVGLRGEVPLVMACRVASLMRTRQTT